MPKGPTQLDLRTENIEDLNTRDSFREVEEYLQVQDILQGQWRYFEVEYSVQQNSARFRHELNFVPRDIIVTCIEGDQRISWIYPDFDLEYIYLDVSGPVRIRGFVGKYDDNRTSNIGTEPLDTVSGGGAATSHSVLTDLSNDDHLQYLTEGRHDALPSDNPHSVTFTQAVTADSGTDITAAEAEQLTDGSNADSLHTHNILNTSEITKVMDCAVSVAVNDWVYQSSSTNNLAITSTNNTEVEPVIGIVKDKPTTTTCTVLLIGVYSGLGGVGRGIIWLGDSGNASTSFPASGTGKVIRQLGFSFGDGNILVDPGRDGVELDDG